jgi:16S rRNA (adenine1518-N6/adenine1519-N6)-dimethyltransferase
MNDKISSIASYAKLFGIIPVKALGQNFIYDKSLCDKIANSSGSIVNKEILEIGPGPAGLTRSILEQQPKKLIVIEKDKRVVPLLEDLKKHYNTLHIINADALKLKLSEIGLEGNIKIVANLPYNIGTQLIINWSKEISFIEDITVMLQKEVVDRICAPTSTKAYGRLSVIMQTLFIPQKLFDVSRDSFYPKPKVTSSIVKLIPNPARYDYKLIEKLEQITQIAFSNRRKQLTNSLGKTYNPEFLRELNITLTQRPEEISPELYVKISENILAN